MLPDIPPSALARGFVLCRDGDAVPAAMRGAVVAVGNFDGVHLGHRTLIAAARDEAARSGRPVAALTFEPHPRRFFRPDAPLFRLTPETEKLMLFERFRLDGAFVRRFDAALAGTSAEDFVAGLLKGGIGASAIVVGQDFHFGRGRAGNPENLAAFCRAQGLDCIVVPTVEAEGEAVSSSAIRAALERGEIERANRLLGHRWFATGTVLHGRKAGRTLGYPTANLRLPEDCGLRHGIYAVRAALAPGLMRDGVASFGRRPTFDNGAPLLEPHLFDFSGDLYGRTISVEFAGFIRGEERFESVEALIRRMDEDSRESRAMLARDRTGSAIG